MGGRGGAGRGGAYVPAPRRHGAHVLRRAQSRGRARGEDGCRSEVRDQPGMGGLAYTLDPSGCFNHPAPDMASFAS